MTYIEIINTISNELNIPIEVVDRVYKSYWQYIKNTIQDLPLKENLTEEKFSQLRTNFNIPSLGKLTCTYDRMQKVKKRFEYIKNLRNSTNENNKNKEN